MDDVVLLGAPLDLNSFSQRMGRGGRRTAQTQVLCMPKSLGKWARFEAFLALASGELQVTSTHQTATNLLSPNMVESVRTYGFRPSVLIQQIFSLIKQSPTGTIRLADVARIALLTSIARLSVKL